MTRPTECWPAAERELLELVARAHPPLSSPDKHGTRAARARDWEGEMGEGREMEGYGGGIDALIAERGLAIAFLGLTP
jgi:hypothetical protein